MNLLKHPTATVAAAVMPLALLTLLLSLLLPAPWSLAEEGEAEGTEIALTAWRIAGPQAAPLPAFHDAEKHGFAVADLLQEAGPEEPEGLPWRDLATQDGALELPTARSTRSRLPHLAYLATYLHASRFAQVQLQVESEHPVKLYLEGEEVEPGKEISLFQGKHRLLLATVWDPGLTQETEETEEAGKSEDAVGEKPWRLTPTLTIVQPEEGEGVVTASTSPARSLKLSDLIDSDWVRGVSVNPAGDRLAVQLRHPSAPADFAESWTEIRSLEPDHEGTVVRTLRCADGSFTWAPATLGAGRHYTYSRPTPGAKDGEMDLWLADLDGGEPKRLLKGVKGLGDVEWMDNGSSLVYAVREEGEQHKDDIKRYRGLKDQWRHGRDRSHLYQLNPGNGAHRRLTAGELSVALEDIHPSGNRLLFTRTHHEYTQHPFTFVELAELDLRTLEVNVLAKEPWLDSAQYAPSEDDPRILVLGSPLAFGGVGKDVPEGTIPNLYDTQGFLLDPQSGEVEPFTKDFDPALNGARWTTEGGILLRIQDGARDALAAYDPKAGGFTDPLDGALGPMDSVRGFSADRTGRTLAWYQFAADGPEEVFVRRGGEIVKLDEPLDDTLADVTLGEVVDWDFDSDAGWTIQGHLHYPPDFDPGKKYPLILQYYGGTVPNDRHFGGRYPHNFWAGLGYVVYTPQPSGATGYGQEFSALHVNDWAKLAAQDILQGARKLLAESDFLDGRVGCFGSSFGGFMTMYLLAHSDVCTTGISHAGISSISSYWGEGWWGYSYSAAATALSYPWNRRDIYIDQSPLFYADQVKAPLLLLHGEVDTNVPIGESRQFYAALKVLGKEVEFLTFAEANHQVVFYDRHRWWLRAVQAWFDKQLRGQPEMWEVLFGER